MFCRWIHQGLEVNLNQRVIWLIRQNDATNRRYIDNLCESKLIKFGFWTVFQTKQAIKVVMLSFSKNLCFFHLFWHFVDWKLHGSPELVHQFKWKWKHSPAAIKKTDRGNSGVHSAAVRVHARLDVDGNVMLASASNWFCGICSCAAFIFWPTESDWLCLRGKQNVSQQRWITSDRLETYSVFMPN